MNKKVYGLLLVVAALFSVGTFESCKDTNTDLYNEVLIKETQNYNELKSRIDAIEQSLCTVDCEALKAEVESLKAEVEALKKKLETESTEQINEIINRIEKLEANYQILIEKIDNIYEELINRIDSIDNSLTIRIDSLEQNLCDVDCEALKAEVDSLKAEIDAIKEQLGKGGTTVVVDLDEIIKRIEALEANYKTILVKIENLEAMIDNLAIQAKGITVQSVYTPAFGSFNSPFGLNNNVILGYCGKAKTALNFNNTVISGDLTSANMGTIYMTVDPLNVDFTGVNVKLVNSKGNTVGVSLSPLKVSDHEILLGYTRATVNNYLYETTATIASHNDVQHVSLDIQGYKNAIKDILTVSDGVTLSALAELVYNTVNQQLTGNAVEIQQKDNAVVSKYEICAASVEPLTLTTFDAIANINADAVSNKIESAANAFVSKIQDALVSKFGSTLVSFNVPSIQIGLDNDIIVTIPAGAIEISIEGKTGSNTDPIDITIPKDDFNNMFNSATSDINQVIADLQEYIIKINNAWTTITTGSSSAIVHKAVETIFNKTMPLVKRLSHAANPAVFVVDGGKVKRLSSIAADPTIIESNEVKIIPSSNTLELAVPFYKKYIDAEGASILVDGSSVNGRVIDGTVFDATMRVTTSGVAKLTYEVVDYSGKPAAREYYVKVK